MSATLGPAYLSGEGGLDRIYDAIEASLPGVQHNMVQLVVWDTIEDFCKRTAFWRFDINWNMPAGQTFRDLNPVDDIARAIWVLEVRGIRHWTVRPPAILVDTGDVRGARGGTVRIACSPRRLADEVVPAFLVDDWSETLRDGALYRLFTQPAKPYSSPSLAMLHGKRYRYGLTQAIHAARYNDHIMPHFPYFAGGGGGRPVVGTPSRPVVVLPPVTLGPPAVVPELWVGPGLLTADDGVPAPPMPAVGMAASVAFAATTVGTDRTQTATLTNTGEATLLITGLTATGDFAVTGIAP